MHHKELVKIFAALMDVKVYQWWRKGPNAVRVRCDRVLYQNNQVVYTGDYIFTYLSEDEWKIETSKMNALAKDGI